MLEKSLSSWLLSVIHRGPKQTSESEITNQLQITHDLQQNFLCISV